MTREKLLGKMCEFHYIQQGLPSQPKDSSMMYLCAVFISPLYFILRGRWVSFIINSIFYGIACVLALSIVGLPIAPFFWIVAAAHAGYSLRKEMMVEQATLIAEKMAERMVRSQPPQPPAEG
jgi:hypothetical protein